MQNKKSKKDKQKKKKLLLKLKSIITLNKKYLSMVEQRN